MLARVRRVVLEYDYQAYSPPDDSAAGIVGCQVACSKGLPVAGRGLNLADVRAQLADMGLTRKGAKIKRMYRHRQFNPRWREVWEAT